MVDYTCKNSYGFDDLVEIMGILRSDNGCPWDREQDHLSIRKNFIEEVYEVAEAIDERDSGHLCEELGDVLLQVVFHAQMEKERGVFDINDVADGICKKLILRHPHIFGSVKADNSEQVLENWDKIKKKEKGYDTSAKSVSGVAKSLPSLMRAQKIQSRADKEGFKFFDRADLFERVRGEVLKLESFDAASRADGEQAAVKNAFGRLLFDFARIGRTLGIDAESVLEEYCNLFCKGFERMENKLASEGRAISELTAEQADGYING